MTTVSLIVPVRNEAPQLAEVLATLKSVMHPGDELIVVDGGSTDHSEAIARRFVDRVIVSAPGRATQMNAGAAVATGQWLWFVHADTRLQSRHRESLNTLPHDALWGRFDVRLSGGRMMFSVIATLMNLRSRLTGIATGDQAIFVRRQAFEQLGGYPDQPLMEDIALSRQLKRQGRPCCIGTRLSTSSRRWEAHGVWTTIWLMWSLRWRYWRGEDPAQLHRDYYGR